MIRAELKGAAKAQIRGNVGILFVCTLIIFGISFAAGLVPIVGMLAPVIVSPPLSVGLCLIYLGLTEGRRAEVGTLFQGFQYFGKSIVLMLLVAVFTFLWSLLLWIPGIIKGLSYSMAYYVMADNPQMSANEALNESKAIMHGHKMELFVLQLSFIPWMLLVAVTFGIAAIYVVPYQSATIANFYQRIKRQPQTVNYKEMI